MKRDEFIKRIKETLESNLRKMYSEIVRDLAHDFNSEELRGAVEVEDEDFTESLQAIQEIETIGDAFNYLCEACSDVGGAVFTALSIAIEDVRDDEFDAVPNRGWST